MNPEPDRVIAPAPADVATSGPPAPTPLLPASVTDTRRRLAWTIAIAVDFVQIVAMPFFVAGGAAPVNALLDVITAVAMIRLLGWHVAFLPTFVAELLPFVDLFPTWTVAVFIASRRR